MTRWYLVPSEPTEGMVEAVGDPFVGTVVLDDLVRGIYTAMVAAPPDPSSDEELVERVARVIEPEAFKSPIPGLRMIAVLRARAILSLFTEKGDE